MIFNEPVRIRWRKRAHELLDQRTPSDETSRWLSMGLIALVLACLAGAILASLPEMKSLHAVFVFVEIIASLVFLIEFLARLWASAETSTRDLSPTIARIRYAFSFWGIIDATAFLTAIPVVFFADYRSAAILQCARLLKLARYSPGLHSLLKVLQAERKALTGCFWIMCGAVFVSATLMYVAEGNVQQRLSTIPGAMWWAIVTLGTIGYGDVVPITPLGRFIASGTIVAGLAIAALPVGIIATAFSSEIHRRDFVVTWGMVAKVPIFSRLSASEIGEVTRRLRAQRVAAREIITRRGEPAHSMYFISAGTVRITLPDRRVVLGPGQFFGEIAALKATKRSATSEALTQVSLLVLDAKDIRELMEREPSIAEHVNSVMDSRLVRNPGDSSGDMVAEELSNTKS